MTVEITYVAVYLFGVSVGILFGIVATGVEYEDFSWMRGREDTHKGDLESSLKQHTVIGLSSNLNFGILKK
jgi:hypothetical protein